ncbi:MAG: CopG family transcriptional regulator [Hyphomonadaceae bacterium]|nr:CopG family transcriptional regulator [Hyphomonadaceae bacterium]
MARKGITVYLPRELEEEVQKLAKAEHRSDSSIIAEAVRMRFTRGPDAHAEAQARESARIAGRLDKVVGESLILKETLLLFVRVWLEHNPPVDEAIEESAAASAEARFERFLDMVAHGLQPGGSVANGELSAAPIGADGTEARP